MSFFVIGYYALLDRRVLPRGLFQQAASEIFLLLFSLTLVSFISASSGRPACCDHRGDRRGPSGAGGDGGLRLPRVPDRISPPENMAKELRTAPLTAAFGMFVIFTYAIAGIFAPGSRPTARRR
jgi:peptide/nickel transport system permease protein